MGIFKDTYKNPATNQTTGGIFKQAYDAANAPDTSYSAGVINRLNLNSQNVGQGFFDAVQKASAQYSQFKTDISNTPNAGLLEKGAQTGKFAGQLAGDVVGATEKVLGGVVGFFGSLIPQDLRDQLSGGVKKILNGPSSRTPEEIARDNSDAALAKTRDQINNLVGIAKSNPDVKDAVVTLLDTILLSAGDVKIPKLSPVLDSLKADLTTSKNVLTSGLNKAQEISSAAHDTIKNKISGVSDVIGNKIKGKTTEQILATPESKLHTLSAEERSVYFANEKTQADIASRLETAKLISEFEGKKIALTKAENDAQLAFKKEAETLSQKLATESRDEVLKLRPKIIESMRVQSNKYRQIVDSEIANAGTTPINGDELSQFIEGKYSMNPETANAMKSRLGIQVEAPKLAKGELPTIQTKASTQEFTAKDLYQKTKDFGKEIKAPVKSGGGVFTADQKLTDDTISTLVEFLKTKGVDLSKARQFWAGYAPVRNQLVREAKPFLSADIGTKTFAERLIRVMKGKDINNLNFIKEVENLLGQKVGKNIQTILTKLTENQKKMVASKIESATKQMELALEKKRVMEVARLGKQYSKINQINREYEIARKAKTREIIIKVIKYAGGLVGLKTAGDIYFK